MAVAFLWPVVAAIVDLLLWAFPDNRKLALLRRASALTMGRDSDGGS